MSIELAKAYNPKETEEKIYKLWEESGFFAPEAHQPQADSPNKNKKFVVCIAPPNITGELHMGHALENTLMDIIVRMKRMQGYKTLWLPGTDHASIATQNVIEKQLVKEGLTRQIIGREEFLKRAWEWKEKYGGAILNQFKRLGLSIDWSRTRFTLDNAYQKSVNAAFFHYYKKGWVYKGTRVVNWCTRCATSISDLEIEYRPEEAKLYYIKYGPFTVATVRPETKLGDTALAVHPKDIRYKNYIGKEIEIESVDNSISPDQEPQKKNYKIFIVGDEAVDQNFGTGIIKVTPSHDITDFEISQRHELKEMKIINEHGRMTEEAGQRYTGLKTKQARELMIEDLKKLGLLEKEEPYAHNITHCERCGSVIEPIPSEQWFLKMKKLAAHAIKAAEKKKIVFIPSKWESPFKEWLLKIRDWNISRQLWWGQKIPAWIHESKCVPIQGKEKDISKCIEIKISESQPTCEYCDAKYIQTEDVFDTWFSSALWPFATLGWPSSAKAASFAEVATKAESDGQARENNDFKEFYPTQAITSAREILYLWIARMVFSGIELTGNPPFKYIYIHPTVLTKEGKRMSKSLGTGINPIDLIEKYGTDALRFGLAYQTTGVQDMRFGEDVILMGKKFANKIWNMSRYVMIKTGADFSFDYQNFSVKKIFKTKKECGEIIKMAEEMAKTVTEQIEKYSFGEAAHTAYRFVWNEFADKFIENSKETDDIETKETLMYVLILCLKILHPFMPFITEEIYGSLPIKDKSLLMVENWPV